MKDNRIAGKDKLPLIRTESTTFQLKPEGKVGDIQIIIWRRKDQETQLSSISEEKPLDFQKLESLNF